MGAQLPRRGSSTTHDRVTGAAGRLTITGADGTSVERGMFKYHLPDLGPPRGGLFFAHRYRLIRESMPEQDGKRASLRASEQQEPRPGARPAGLTAHPAMAGWNARQSMARE